MHIALANGTASEWKNGLAWVIIGGLLSSMILTVYLVPMMYYIVDTIKEKIANRKVGRNVDKANLSGEYDLGDKVISNSIRIRK